MSTDDIDAFLAHHGIKGMHWGVRRNLEESQMGSNKKDTNFNYDPSKLNKHDKSVLKAVNLSPDQSPAMQAKYGPNSNKPGHHLTKAQKKLIIYGAIGVGVVGLGFYLNKKGKELQINNYVNMGVKRPTAEYLLKSNRIKGVHARGIKDLSELTSEDLNFKPGHIFSRVSTELEKDIRPEGFFAANNSEDLERYKAVLPVYWKMWEGVSDRTSGYVNHYASETPIKIASEKTVFDIIKNSLNDNGGSIRKLLSYSIGQPDVANEEELVKKTFYNVIASFADPSDPVVKHITMKLKAAGYHGIIDSNDAGSLGKSPVKLIDGTIFKIVGNEVLSESAIQKAQNVITDLKHILEFVMSYNNKTDIFLAHHGVKGMHWGIRRIEAQAKSDANEFTKAKLFYGEGAGNRRKLIKAKVEQRSKNPEYQKAFKEHLAKQDLEKRASQATRVRRRKDTIKFTTKTARGVHRSLTGGFGSVGLSAAAIASGAVYLHSSGTDKILIKKASDFAANQSAQRAAKQWLRNAGAV